MSLTMKHLVDARRSRKPFGIEDDRYFQLKQGLVTLQYPHQEIAVPENGRYQLDCEIDDCIVCDKCAKICPVDCIDIEAIKSSELISYASDGSPIRLYAAKFDIDMAKCCFCGLCTTVCPTECLTMTNEFDFSVADVAALNFAFSKLTPEVADEKRKLYEQYMLEKQQNAAQKKVEKTEPTESIPSFKPAFKPAAKSVTSTETEIKSEETPKPKPAFRPVVKPQPLAADENKVEEVAKPKPVFRPTMKAATATSEPKAEDEAPNPKPVFKPSMKPTSVENKVEEPKVEVAKPKPVFRPTMKAVAVEKAEEDVVKEPEIKEEVQPRPKPVFRPTMKPEQTNIEIPKAEENIEQAKPIPVFRPKMKPAVADKPDENNG